MSLSIWEKESFYAPCDVLIVGAGLLGLWTARELKIKRPSQKVTLIDKDATPAGASVRNAGFACFGSPSELIHDAKLLGEAEMWKVAAMRFKGIEKIRQVFSDDLTGFENTGGYEGFENADEKDWPSLREDLQWLNKGLKAITGYSEVFQVADDKLASNGLEGFAHLIENRLEGGLHSGGLIQALLANVVELGVTVITGMEFKGFEVNNDSIKVLAAGKDHKSHAFSTQQLVMATNAHLSRQFPALGIQPARGQIILSPPIKNLALSGTFHFDGGYYYFRNLGDRLLLGGARNHDFEGEATLEIANTGVITQNLYDFIRQHIPQAAAFPLDAYDKWSGIMAMHPSKQPVLAQVENNVWVAMCCNGMGVALSPVFAESVVAAVNNEPF